MTEIEILPLRQTVVTITNVFSFCLATQHYSCLDNSYHDGEITKLARNDYPTEDTLVHCIMLRSIILKANPTMLLMTKSRKTAL